MITTRSLEPLDEFSSALSRWSLVAGETLPQEWAATMRVVRARRDCLVAALSGTRARPGLLDESRRLATEQAPLQGADAGCVALRELARVAVRRAIDPEVLVQLRRDEALDLLRWLAHVEQLLGDLVEAGEEEMSAGVQGLLEGEGRALAA